MSIVLLRVSLRCWDEWNSLLTASKYRVVQVFLLKIEAYCGLRITILILQHKTQVYWVFSNQYTPRQRLLLRLEAPGVTTRTGTTCQTIVSQDGILKGNRIKFYSILRRYQCIICCWSPLLHCQMLSIFPKLYQYLAKIYRSFRCKIESDQ